jgi:hypothetical protein
MISSYDSCTKESWAMKNRFRHQKSSHAEFTDDRFDRKEIEERRDCRLSHAWRKDSW